MEVSAPYNVQQSRIRPKRVGSLSDIRHPSSMLTSSMSNTHRSPPPFIMNTTLPIIHPVSHNNLLSALPFASHSSHLFNIDGARLPAYNIVLPTNTTPRSSRIHCLLRFPSRMNCGLSILLDSPWIKHYASKIELRCTRPPVSYTISCWTSRRGALRA